ncbi:MAG: hypothetical protein IPL43_00360 [Micropruina sp.]|nr:hypothetical protein [Micropruina sp.]
MGLFLIVQVPLMLGLSLFIASHDVREYALVPGVVAHVGLPYGTARRGSSPSLLSENTLGS